MHRHLLIAEYLSYSSWALPESYLAKMIAIFNEGGDIQAAISHRDSIPKEAYSMKVTADGTAVIPLIGPVFPRANLFTQMSGATSIEVLFDNFKKAMKDPNVKRVVFNISSPGGAVEGIEEMAEAIYASRGQKPITAYVSGWACSAAYWIASACDKIYLGASSEVGSIGVVATYVDRSAQMAASGIKVIEFVSSVSPAKRPDLNSPEGQAIIQANVDALGDVFVDTVAKYRGVTRDKVLKDFGAGDVKVGKLAVAAGMADEVITLDKHLSGGVGAFIRKGASKMDENNVPKAEHDRLVNAAREEGKQAGILEGHAQGVAAEQKRIKDIEALKVPGYEAFINERKYNDGATAASISQDVLAEQEKRRTDAAAKVTTGKDKLANDTKGVGASAATTDGEPSDEDKEAARQKRVAAAVKGAQKYRGEKPKK